MDCGEEIGSGLVVARCDGAELLEATVEVFDEMARLVDLLVERARVLAVAFWRDDAGLASCLERPDDAQVGIESLVGQQSISLHVRQQSVRPLQIMGLAWGQEEAEGIAQSIDQGVDLGAQSAFAPADRLIFAVFFWAPALC
jgi:hypothetical protein